MSFFTTQQEFGQFVPIGLKLDPEFVKLPAQISIAETQFLTKEVGRNFLSELRAAYANASETIYQAEARVILQKCLANFAIALFIPKHKLQIDSSGVREVEDSDRKGAKPYDTAEAIKAYDRDGWIALEELLEYLEANRTEFPTWAGSAESTHFRNSFIRTTFDLEQYSGIRVSRRLFKRIKPHLSMAARAGVVPVTGAPFYQELLNQHLAGNLSPENAKLLESLCIIVAHGALKSAMSLLPVEFSDDGLTVAANTSNANMVRTRTAANDTRVADAAAESLRIYDEEVSSLTGFLQKNADSYPLFKESGAYRPASNGASFTNDPNSPTLMF